MSKQPKPTKHSVSVLYQLCKLIPVGLVKDLFVKHQVEGKCRTFSAWSHVVCLLYSQLVHAIGLNDVCDGLRHHAAKLAAIRGATPPSRNGLSHANKHRNSDMMEALFWQVLGHSKHAIRWQLWAALLLYVLLRFQQWCWKWPHSFTRLFTLLRGIAWDRYDLGEILSFYGTAGERWRMKTCPQTAYLPGLAP